MRKAVLASLMIASSSITMAMSPIIPKYTCFEEKLDIGVHVFADEVHVREGNFDYSLKKVSGKKDVFCDVTEEATLTCFDLDKFGKSELYVDEDGKRVDVRKIKCEKI